MKDIPFQEKPEKERNEKIIQLYQQGSYSYNSLSRIFKISPQRVGQIIKKYQKKNETGGV